MEVVFRRRSGQTLGNSRGPDPWDPGSKHFNQVWLNNLDYPHYQDSVVQRCRDVRAQTGLVLRLQSFCECAELQAFFSPFFPPLSFSCYDGQNLASLIHQWFANKSQILQQIHNDGSDAIIPFVLVIEIILWGAATPQSVVLLGYLNVWLVRERQNSCFPVPPHSSLGKTALPGA